MNFANAVRVAAWETSWEAREWERRERSREVSVTSNHRKNVVGIFYHLANLESPAGGQPTVWSSADKHDLIDLTVHYLDLI